MNKTILTWLLDLPFNKTASDIIFTVGMDWTGPMTYVFAVKKVKDVYLAKTISILLMSCRLSKILLIIYMYGVTIT
ncbi:hypothetical protein BDF21DRAFT_415757 [Thamnidium elegans]|nr:hypothetical protein BDF21DRAFT_415757 [Thamnidium elegans]